MSKLLRFILLSCLLAQPTLAEEKYWQYEFIEGDSVWSISQRFLKNWRDWGKLQDLNDITQDTRVRPGTRINIPVDWLDSQSAPVNIASISGDVRLFDPNGNSISFAEGLEVAEGYALETGAEASALLIFKDGSKLLVQQDTRIEFDSTTTIGGGFVYNYKIDMPRGEIENRANPQRTPGSTFLIETPSSTTATRGTIYRVRTDGLLTGTEVTQGKVGVGNALGEQRVAAGFGLVTEKGKKPSKPVKLLSAPTLPALLGKFRYLPSEVTWPKLTGAQRYRIQVSRSENFDMLSFDTLLSDTRWSLPLAISDGNYYLRVRGIDDKGLEGQNSQSQFTVAAQPVPAVHIGTSESIAQYSDDITLRWSRVAGAVAYRVEVMLGTDERALVHRSKIINDTEYTLAVDAVGHYQWRVTGLDANNALGPKGHLGRFEAINRPYRPSKKTAANDALVLHWPTAPQQAYTVQIAKDEQFTNIAYEHSYTGEVSGIQGLPRGSYYVRYQIIDEQGKLVNTSPVHAIHW